jgi:hypothetical protein
MALGPAPTIQAFDCDSPSAGVRAGARPVSGCEVDAGANEQATAIEPTSRPASESSPLHAVPSLVIPGLGSEA